MASSALGRVRTTLVDPEQRHATTPVRPQPAALGNTTFGPPDRAIDGLPHGVRLGGQLDELVERHGNVAANAVLKSYGLFGRQHVAASVEMRAELDTLVGHLVEVGQAHDLKAAAVGENRPRPAHEPVEPSHLLKRLDAGPQ